MERPSGWDYANPNGPSFQFQGRQDTKPIGKGISEARARDGARVYFRQLADGTIEILGKSTKANQGKVIKEVLRVFGN